MGAVSNARMAGSIIRRVREDLGITRASPAARTGISIRTLYALESGQSKNFGLGNYFALLHALGLTMSIDFNNPDTATIRKPVKAPLVREYELADMWRLDRGDGE